MSELKSCPFCGYEHTALETMQVRKGWEADAQCLGCLANMHSITYDTEQKAVEAITQAWNTRTQAGGSEEE